MFVIYFFHWLTSHWNHSSVWFLLSSWFSFWFSIVWLLLIFSLLFPFSPIIVYTDNKTDTSNILPWSDTTQQTRRTIRSGLRNASNTSHALPLAEETTERRRPRQSIPAAGAQIMSAFSWDNWLQHSNRGAFSLPSLLPLFSLSQV